MNWKLPNQLTVGRIVLAAAFFVLIGLYEHGMPSGPWLLNSAFVIYIVAGVTDILDGYLARKMNASTAFGRIVDPFVDKILVVGAFAMLAGANYSMPADMASFEHEIVPAWLLGGMSSAVQAWMVVAVMGREFVVSAVRGYSESRGVKFPATPAGKLKMFLQSVAICSVLYQLANLQGVAWAVVVKVVTVWLAVTVTVFSGLMYVGKTRDLLRSEDKDRETA